MSATAHIGRKTAAPGLLILAVVAAVLASIGAGTASAKPTADNPAASGAVKVAEAKMVLNCTNMSKSVHQYAVAHDYCPPAGAGDVGTNGIVYGNCGSSEIWIDDAPGVGWASITYGFYSQLGGVVYRSLSVGFVGDDNTDTWTDSGWMASASYYAGNTVWTGIGYASAHLGGSVTLFWGATCYLLQPSSGEYIY